MRAIGFHGTSIERAERILAEGFQASRNEYDWLGDGAYFFQDGKVRAAEWARQQFGDDSAVIGAELELTDCVDLLDPHWHDAVRESYSGFVEGLRKEGLSPPRQTAGAHRLDRAVLNRAVEILETRGERVRSVRGVFVEGEPLFPGSALFSRAHIQIAVRDASAIVRLWRAA
jgi:hypothetical protein